MTRVLDFKKLIEVDKDATLQTSPPLIYGDAGVGFMAGRIANITNIGFINNHYHHFDTLVSQLRAGEKITICQDTGPEHIDRMLLSILDGYGKPELFADEPKTDTDRGISETMHRFFIDHNIDPESVFPTKIVLDSLANVLPAKPVDIKFTGKYIEIEDSEITKYERYLNRKK